MKTNTASAVYGYQELRVLHQRYMMLGLLAATLLQLTTIGGYHISQWLEPPDPPIIHIPYKPIDLPPPPPLDPGKIPQVPINPLLPGIIDNGIPVPVPDAIANPEKTIPTQKDLNEWVDPRTAEFWKGGGTFDVYEPLNDPDPLPEVFLAIEKDPMVVTHPAPEYPELALRIGMEGNVFVNALVDKNGKVKKGMLLK
jgi:hypothetical protein